MYIYFRQFRIFSFSRKKFTTPKNFPSGAFLSLCPLPHYLALIKANYQVVIKTFIHYIKKIAFQNKEIQIKSTFKMLGTVLIKFRGKYRIITNILLTYLIKLIMLKIQLWSARQDLSNTLRRL